MQNVDPLILDLLEWLDREPRRYREVMDAWRTSCPRLPVWEDSVDRGFVARDHVATQDGVVRLTDQGRAFLRRNRAA